MQHDTSPHEVQLDGKRRKVQTASAVRCYSRMLFFQLYPTFKRFDCTIFLVDASPLTTVRALANYLPVIDEVLEMEVGEEYFQYAQQKLERLRSS